MNEQAALTADGAHGGGVMFKLFAAVFAIVFAAALLAGAMVAIPGLTAQVEAHMLPTKGDRIDLKSYGSACSERGWPYFETTCLRDARSPLRQARSVRIVSTDRCPKSPARTAENATLAATARQNPYGCLSLR